MALSSRSRQEQPKTRLSLEISKLASSLCFALWLGVAYPAEIFTPIDPQLNEISSVREVLQGDQVVRHRFVNADIQTLWKLLESAENLEESNDQLVLPLRLFDDFVVEMKPEKIRRSYWRISAVLVPASGQAVSLSGEPIFGWMILRRGESVSIDIQAGSIKYHVMPVDGGPIHAISEVDWSKVPGGGEM